MGYFTRQKARKAPPLKKLLKGVVTAVDALLREDMENVTDEEMEKAREFLENEIEKDSEDGTKKRILKVIKRFVDGEEPGETDDEEEQEGDDGVEEEDLDDMVEDNLEDEEGEAILVLNKKVQKDETARKEKDAEEEKKKDEKENMKEDDTKGKEIHTSLKTTFTGVRRSHSVDRIADTSVTEKTIESNDRDPMTFRLQRASALLSEDDNMTTRSQSLASLLTAAHPTPLRSIRSASSHSMFAEETLSRRARRSSQDLAHLILLSEKSQLVTPAKTADNSVVCLDSLKKRYESVVYLGPVKKPTPPLITIEDTPRRMSLFPKRNSVTTTPHLPPPDLVSVRSRLRRVFDSPVEPEVRHALNTTMDESALERMVSPVHTDRRVVSMEISPPSPEPPQPKPRRGLRRNTPFPGL